MDTKYRTHFVSFLKSIERTNLLQKWLPYSDRFWRKKNPFLVTLYDSSSKIYTYMYNSMHLFLHLSRGSIKKKLAKQVEKRSSPRVSVVPFQLLPSLPLKKNSISSGNENKNICCRDFFHEIQAYFDLFSMLPEHFGVWVGPKNTLTKFMVSWLLGRFVPESKPSCFFLHTGCTAFPFPKN